MMNKSSSDDAERNMLSKLRIESGTGFTRDLEGMLKDVKSSEEILAEWKSWKEKRGSSGGIELGVMVLTSSFWPLNSLGSGTGGKSASGSGERDEGGGGIVWPKIFMSEIARFEEFYKRRHTGRKLSWNFSYGNVDLKVKFGKKKVHELNVSTLGAVVLLLFEDEMGYEGDGVGSSGKGKGPEEDRWLTFKEIQASTLVHPNELKKVLISLSAGKFKVLQRQGEEKEIKEGDKFRLNLGFKSDTYRIKIQNVTNKVETVEERKETNERVDDERRHKTEVCRFCILSSTGKILTRNDRRR
jgi:cullin 3